MNAQAGRIHHRVLVIFCLILAGEAVFALPFHIPRFFRATMLDVFGLSNAQLGDAFAVYGVTAMLAYFPGGTIADRFSARQLITVSLIATSLGGLYLAQVPSFPNLSLLFAYWGVTSILLFWAALIRSTRSWGGELSQGRAFGILDGGRGLLAAGLASVAVVLFSMALAVEPELASPEERRSALITLIYFYTGVTFAAGIAAWFLVPESQKRPRRQLSELGVHAIRVIREPIVWAQAAIVVSAYCGFKGLDNYALYAVDVLGMNEVDAAAFAAANAYIRPVAAVVIGFAADRFRASRVIGALFVILLGSYLFLGFAAPMRGGMFLIHANIILTFAGVYGLRAVYFALLEETRVPPGSTGAAVGLISLVGFTPDIFFASIGGRLLDQSPGLTGHQHYFLLLASFMVLGLIATAVLIHFARRRALLTVRSPAK